MLTGGGAGFHGYLAENRRTLYIGKVVDLLFVFVALV